DRSPDFPIAVLAVFKAGGAYVPLDPAYPPARLARMLEDSGARVLLTRREWMAHLPASDARVFLLGESADLEARPATNPVPAAGPGDVAYVLYTSGTTGVPKGVAVEHGTLLRLAEQTHRALGLHAGARVLQFASPSFDASLWELSMAWYAGAELHLAHRDELLPGPGLVSLLRERGITHTLLPPSVLAQLPDAALPELRTLLVGGEACPAEVASRWSTGRRLVNAYGPTEATVCTTLADCAPGEPPPLGQPFPHASVYLLDPALAPVAPGAPGELYIGGDGLARGYLHRPDLTAERFMPDPFSPVPGARMYRTGDVARLRPDGQLAFLGRADDQVKVRGFRIELGEVEAVLSTHPGVRQSVVVAREDGPEGRRLVAYVVARPDAAADVSGWRAFLQERLPAHCVPSAFVPLEALPLAPTGKVDRGALPAPGADRPPLATAYRAPSTPLEAGLARILERLLRVAPVGAEDDFFELGGDSLQAARVISAVNEAYGAGLPVRALFAAPTPARLAARVEAGRGVPREEPLVAREHGDGAPLSFAQQRLWFLHRLDPRSAAYILPLELRLDGPLQPEALARSLEEILRRHEALRTVFTVRDGEPLQVVLPPASWALPVVTLPPGEPGRAALQALARETFTQPFDLARGPLVRAVLARREAREHVLLLAMHHIVADGWSMGVLLRELVALYPALRDGRPSPLPPLPVQYADHALWQRRWLDGERLERQRAYWTRRLAGAPHVLEVPGRRPRPAVQSFRGARVEFQVPAATVRALERLGQAEGATLFMVLLAAFKAWLHQRTGAEDVVVGTPVANRHRTESFELIGFFANTLALRTRLHGDPTFRELLLRVREGVLEDSEHPDLPFERLVEALRPERDLRRQPLVQVMLAFQGSAPEARVDGLRLRLSEGDSGAAPFDLTWNVWRSGEGLACSVVFSTDLYEAPDVDEMAAGWRAVLDAVATEPERRLSALPGATASAERARPEALEAALLAEPDVVDCAVVWRPDRAGTPRSVAYVVEAGAGRASHAAGPLQPRLRIPVRALPLTPSGAADVAALAGLEAIDSELVASWEARLRSLPEVADVAVVAHAPREPVRPLHLSELLPGWRAVERPPASAGSGARGTAPGAQRPLAFADGGPLEPPEDSPRTLVDALLRAAAGPRGILHVLPDGSQVHQPYAALLDEARRVLSGLRARGLGPGDRVILQAGSSPDYVRALWGCLLGGITPVTVAVAPSFEPSNRVVRKLAGVWELLGRPPVVASGSLMAPLSGLRDSLPLPGLRLIDLEELGGHPPAGQLHPCQPGDVALLQLSSGSTSVPKCIQLRHEGILRHTLGSARLNGYSAEEVWLNWLPFDHVVPVLMYHLRPVCLGSEQIHVKTEQVLAEPLLWLELLESCRVTQSWAPNFGFKLVSDALARQPGRSWDLSSLRRLLNAGEQVTLPVVEEFLQRVAPFGVRPEVMQPAYGMAELCTVVTYANGFGSPGSARAVRKDSLSGELAFVEGEDASTVTFVGVGPPIPGVRLRVVDAANRPLREGMIGRLQVHGGVVTPGYLHHDAANREAFAGDGWFNTGDLAFLLGGELTITGREKEMIIVRGSHFYCHEIEDLVSGVEGVLPTYVGACGVDDVGGGTEGLAIFFVPRVSGPEAVAKLCATLTARVTQRLGITPSHVVPLAQEAFPKTTSGKIQRASLKQGLAEGRYDAVLREVDLRLGNAHTVPDWFHQPRWVPREVGPEAGPRAGSCLIFADALGLAAELMAGLARAGRACVTVEPGPGFEQVGAGRYRMDPGNASHHERLLGRLALEGGLPEAVLHLGAYDEATEGPPDAARLARARERGAHGVLLLVQALARANTARQPMRLLLVSSHAQPTSRTEPISCEKALLSGLARTVPQEVPWLDCRQVDLELDAAGVNAPRVLRELHAARREPEVAYREGRRLVSRLERVDWTAMPTQAPVLVEDGVYLVTGGLGGLGLELSGFLLQHYRARVLLIGRRPLEEDAGRRAALEAL
ncbi:MAG TPA: amino acid adenylation domain-containing protein, partial [Myxococcus sp.]|nr:amino acid adenylation domain-containing protein [Myxococcus sp.]